MIITLIIMWIICGALASRAVYRSYKAAVEIKHPVEVKNPTTRKELIGILFIVFILGPIGLWLIIYLS